MQLSCLLFFSILFSLHSSPFSFKHFTKDIPHSYHRCLFKCLYVSHCIKPDRGVGSLCMGNPRLASVSAVEPISWNSEESIDLLLSNIHYCCWSAKTFLFLILLYVLFFSLLLLENFRIFLLSLIFWHFTVLFFGMKLSPFCGTSEGHLNWNSYGHQWWDVQLLHLFDMLFPLFSDLWSFLFFIDWTLVATLSHFSIFFPSFPFSSTFWVIPQLLSPRPSVISWILLFLSVFLFA